MNGQRGTQDDARGARRWSVDVGILLVIGILMGFLAPFASGDAPLLVRYAYWVVCLVGGGLIAVAADEILRRRAIGSVWRVVAASVAVTPIVALYVVGIETLFGVPFELAVYGRLLWQVWPVLAAILAVRALVWRRPATRVETRIVIAPPLPGAEAAFRRRLSARHRHARLLAVEAHDHYLKVHTDAGTDMIMLRLADAVEELGGAHGWRVHRSWWVAADAVQSGRWRRNSGELQLEGGLLVPVSRAYAATLRSAGWF